MFKDFYAAFYYGILIVAASISLLYFKKVTRTFKWLCMLIIITLVSELIAKYFSLKHHPNSIIYIILTPIEYSIYAMIYSLFFKSKLWTRILFGSVVCLMVLEILNILFFSLQAANNNMIEVEGILLVAASLKLFIDIREKPVYENIFKESVFWFNSVVLLYYSNQVLFYGIHDLIYRLKNPPNIVYQILLLFSGFLYIGYTISILLNNFPINKTVIQK
ncbi:MAG TPA: hypothetical protein VGI43_19960 [Mucilaginibacter sp.]|jgi:hypothetical protein